MSTATKMHAIGFNRSLIIEDEYSLISFEEAYPTMRELDVIVKVSAVSVNPADAKVRIRSALETTLESPRIIGFDAVGEVVSVGPGVTDFSVADRVYFAGDASRQGSNAEYQVVDSRIIALAPAKLSDAQAAVLPLTSLTACEALFERLRISKTETGKTLLIIGGAGGVGSIATQIAKHFTELTVITTASRAESISWARKMGADHVADHRDLINSVKQLGFETVDYIFNTADTIGHWDAMAELIAPQGMICSIVEFEGSVDLNKLQGKSAGFVWELMFTKSSFNTPDIKSQGEILKEIAGLMDSGHLTTTLTETLYGLSEDTLKSAHKKIESGATVGKIAIQY
ncbi:NADPH:quinone reductase ['Osedax' symbiont bacterium Rs2_46_30_T18]|nr:NADPH:quinone reductase ['Osedax' symbiont bacterium Rs2_46_30_T18]